MNTSDFLRIAVHKSGVLNEKTIKLLKDCGIKFDSSLDKLRAYSNNAKIELLFFHQDDIPSFVNNGDVEVGIIGMEIFEKSGENVELLSVQLNISQCQLSLLVPNNRNFESISDLEGKKIATCYPSILRKKLAECNTKAEILQLSQDTVQLTSFLGIADAIFDKVLDENNLTFSGLKALDFFTENFNIAIVFNSHMPLDKLKILEKLQLKINSVLEGKISKYVIMNVPKISAEDVLEVLPSLESPTVVQLHQTDWVAIHTVIEENDFWARIELLRKAGAEGILVMPIEKMLIR